MNLTCPSCATTFVVETEQLGASGRQVRCGSCGNSWHQTAENEAPKSAPAPAPAPASADAESPDVPEKRARRRVPRPPRQKGGRGGSPMLLGWVFFLLVVGGLAAGLYYGRAQVLALVPAAASLYEMAGLMSPPAAMPLELRDVTTARRIVDGEQVVVIEGLVSNATGEPQSVPLLRASLIDSEGDEVESWTFAASATALPPGGATDFETTTKNPPREGRILIDFAVTP